MEPLPAGLVRREEGLQAQFVNGDVVRCAQRGNGREQVRLDPVLAQHHRQEGQGGTFQVGLARRGVDAGQGRQRVEQARRFAAGAVAHGFAPHRLQQIGGHVFPVEQPGRQAVRVQVSFRTFSAVARRRPAQTGPLERARRQGCGARAKIVQ